MDDFARSRPARRRRLRRQVRRQSPATAGEPRAGLPPVARRAQHVRREIADVKDNVLRMGSMVESQIHAAIDALVRHDAEAALKVILGDRPINDVQWKVTAMIAETIATQSPVARDLRYLLTLDHVSYELGSGLGDHAGSVAKQARKLRRARRSRTTSSCPSSGSGSRSTSTGSSVRLSTSTRSGPCGRGT